MTSGAEFRFGPAVSLCANMMDVSGLEMFPSGPRLEELHSFPIVGPYRHTLNPMVTGTFVLGVKCNGVLIAADMLGSYGSLARFSNTPES